MDFVTGLPLTKSGNNAVAVFVDKLSKMVRFRSCKTTDGAAETAWMFVDSVYRHHGMPRMLITDRDVRFQGEFWKEVHKLLQIEHRMSTAFHPQTDGQTERVNRVLEEMLRHFVSPEQTDWDKFLPLAEFAVNSSWHESVQATPFFLNYGQHPRCPVSLDVDTKVPAAQEFTTGIEEAIKRAKKCLAAAQDRQKSYADKKRRDESFKKGDKVLLSTKNIRLKTPGTNKLMPKWVGPFEVLEKLGKVAYKLQLPANIKIHPVFHVSLLKPHMSDGRVQPPPPAIETDDGLFFEVEAVLDHRDRKYGRKKRREYLIKWSGYDPLHNTWEPAENLKDVSIAEYWADKV
jgi:hypothetical protein